jgi:(hydroxyamino)benzene mutase
MLLEEKHLDENFVNEYKRRFLWHGFFLCFLGFIVPLFMPFYANPRTGLATHLLGITSGLFLMGVGLTLPYLKISQWIAKVKFWLLLVSSYIGLVAEFLGALFGLKNVFIVTGKDSLGGALWLEIGVEVSIKTITAFILVSCLIILFGLRRIKEN